MNLNWIKIWTESEVLFRTFWIVVLHYIVLCCAVMNVVFRLWFAVICFVCCAELNWIFSSGSFWCVLCRFQLRSVLVWCIVLWFVLNGVFVVVVVLMCCAVLCDEWSLFCCCCFSVLCCVVCVSLDPMLRRQSGRPTAFCMRWSRVRWLLVWGSAGCWSEGPLAVGLRVSRLLVWGSAGCWSEGQQAVGQSGPGQTAFTLHRRLLTISGGEIVHTPTSRPAVKTKGRGSDSWTLLDEGLPAANGG